MSGVLRADQLIGSRYRLTERDIDQLPYPGVSVWHAVDTMLKNSVRILVLDSNGEYFSEVLDAARRASLFDDVHAVKILRVDSDSEYGWIVTEIPLGFPLSYRMNGEKFSPEQAKALVGETARVIASATSQGIRHLDVKPADVRIDSQGQVFVDGLGIYAALAGIRTDTFMPHELERKEAASLTRLYAQLLTGDTESDPATLIQDLSQDDNCDPSLRYFFERSLRGAGAVSPSDLIRHLGSWDAIDVASLPVIPGMQMGEVADENMDAELGIPYAPAILSVPKWPSARHAKENIEVEERAETEEMSAGSVESESEVSETNMSTHKKTPDEETHVEKDSVVEKGAASEEIGTANDNVGDNNGHKTKDVPATEEKAPSGETSAQKSFLASLAAKTSQSTKQFSEKTVSGIASVAGSKVVRQAMSSLERQMDKVSDIPEGSKTRHYNTSWLFMVISVVLVGVAGIWALMLFFSTPDVKVVNQGPTGSAPIHKETPSIDPENNTPEHNSLVASVELYNPQASNLATSEGVTQDNPDTVGKIADGNTSTVWQSWWYPTSQFTAGKDGLGLQIKLKEPIAVDNVYIQVNGTGGNIQWLADASDSTNVIAESTMSTATYLIAPQPVTTDTVTLWITELPIDKTKKNRVVIAELDFNRQVPDVLRQAAQSQ